MMVEMLLFITRSIRIESVTEGTESLKRTAMAKKISLGLSTN